MALPRSSKRSPVGLINNRPVLLAGFGPWNLTEWVKLGLLERLVPRLVPHRRGAGP